VTIESYPIIGSPILERFEENASDTTGSRRCLYEYGEPIDLLATINTTGCINDRFGSQCRIADENIFGGSIRKCSFEDKLFGSDCCSRESVALFEKPPGCGLE
jgi:hypothetical protein